MIAGHEVDPFLVRRKNQGMDPMLAARFYRLDELRCLPTIHRFLYHPHAYLNGMHLRLLVHGDVENPFMP